VTAREYFAILDSVIRGARDHGILRKESTADDLIPEARLDFISSATATIYIQAQRRTGSALTPAPPAAGKDGNPADGSPASPSVEAPQMDGDGIWYFTCAACRQRKRWSPRGASAGKAPWPGAKCWDCYKGAKL